MKEIQLNKEKVTFLDDIDYELLNQYNWFVNSRGYVVRNKNGKTSLMHREIMNTPEGMDTDHIDGNKLNNQRNNLRVCTHAENMRNRKVQKNNQSRVKGVYWEKRTKKWHAQINIDGHNRFLGRFLSLEEAKTEYERAAKKHHKDFANF